MDIKLNKPQHRAFHSKYAETFFIGGIGSGKTFFIALRLLNALNEPPGAVCGLFAPTQKVINNSTLSAIKNAWRSFGLTEGINGDYVIGIRPPAKWGIQSPYQKHNKILTTRRGSFCIIDGLDNYDSQRGLELDEVFIDEYRDTKMEEVRNLFLGRMRGVAYKNLKKTHRIWYVTSPPEDPTYLINLKNNQKNIGFFFGSSKENEKNLPSGYLESLMNCYDSRVYEREALGMLVHINENKFMYCFDENKHVSDIKYNDEYPIYLSFDFNVSPMTCSIWQTDRRTFAHCIDEIYINNATVYDVIDIVKTRYPDCVYYVTGDSNGGARTTVNNYTAYQIINTELGISRQRYDTPLSNPDIRDSRILCNSMLTHFDGLRISTKCKHLIHDLNYTKSTKDGKIDKSDEKLTHLLDTFRYFLFTYFNNKFAIKRINNT